MWRGGIMIWVMILPNGLLSFHVINRKFKSADYIGLLKNYAVPIIKMNKKSQFSFQQDNCTVYKSKIVKAYMENTNFKRLHNRHAVQTST